MANITVSHFYFKIVSDLLDFSFRMLYLCREFKTSYMCDKDKKDYGYNMSKKTYDMCLKWELKQMEKLFTKVFGKIPTSV